MRKIFSLLTIFIGSALIFGVQPMVANTLLPMFGGTAAVWTVTLAAFQTLLLIGYFYAHVLSARKQSFFIAHVILLVFSAVWCFMVANRAHAILNWIDTVQIPAICALASVIVLIGVPYILLSANSSLVQVISGGNYKLYAISNLGSLIGLLVYPFIVEPLCTVTAQWTILGYGLTVYAISLLILVFTANKKIEEAKITVENIQTTNVKNSPCLKDAIEWFGLSALSCFMLNAITVHLTAELTPMPLLWAILLSLYLASYIVAFTDIGGRIGKWINILVTILSGGAYWLLSHNENTYFSFHLIVGAGLIFFGGWAIHSRLYRARPGAEGLTKYYLYLALGGACGGLLASIGFPLLTSFVAEYPLAIVFLIIPALMEIDELLRKYNILTNRWWYLGGLAVLAALSFARTHVTDGKILWQSRNFYGTCRVVYEPAKVTNGFPYFMNNFYDNGTMHGYQVADLETGWKKIEPTSYFGMNGGGIPICSHTKYKQKKPLRVAIAGMGIGTLAAYGRKGDYYRFYDINPNVVKMATDKRLYTFVPNCEAKVDIIINDARKALEREREKAEEKWDVIIIDVFSGDSIPVHLATKEAFQLYLDRLAPNGILAFHITNWHLELSCMVKSMAKEFGLQLQGTIGQGSQYCCISYWAHFTHNPIDLSVEGRYNYIDYSKVKDLPVMTDERHSILSYIGDSNPPLLNR